MKPTFMPPNRQFIVPWKQRMETGSSTRFQTPSSKKGHHIKAPHRARETASADNIPDGNTHPSQHQQHVKGPHHKAPTPATTQPHHTRQYDVQGTRHHSTQGVQGTVRAQDGKHTQSLMNTGIRLGAIQGNTGQQQ